MFGATFLFVTFVSTVTTVESAFNAIWDHAPQRTLGRRITDYFGVMVVAPLLLAVAVSVTAAVQSNIAVSWLMQTWGLGTAARAALPYVAWVAVWALFAFLYMFVPNTRVRLVPAAIAGAIAGSIRQLTHWAYIGFQIGLQGYNAVYGTLAQLPLLLVWIYLSWVIVLLGAEIAWAIQTVPIYSRERRGASKSGQTFREWITLGVCVELARAAEERTPRPRPRICRSSSTCRCARSATSWRRCANADWRTPPLPRSTATSRSHPSALRSRACWKPCAGRCRPRRRTPSRRSRRAAHASCSKR